MKNKLYRIKALALAVSVLSTVASAQMPGSGISTSMIKLFPDNSAFTAKVAVRVLDAKGTETLRMPSNFSLLDGKLRLDVDWGQIVSVQLNPAAVTDLRKAGLDHVSSVIRPDKKALYIIYPAAKSYANMPMTAEEADLAGLKLTQTPLGRETIDGHPCVKNRSVVKNQKGVTVFDGTTWNATDMQNFPLQIQTKDPESGNTSVMHFQQVSFARPETKQFDAPAGCKQFTNPAALQAAAFNRVANPNKQ